MGAQLIVINTVMQFMGDVSSNAINIMVVFTVHIRKANEANPARIV